MMSSPSFVSESVTNGQRKRFSSGSPDCPHLHKKICRQTDMMESQKLANFSMAPNGVNKTSVLGKKQGSEKKILAIKNFKGNPGGFILLFVFGTNAKWMVWLMDRVMPHKEAAFLKLISFH